MWYFFVCERINSYIQYGWDELLLKDPNGKMQDEKRKENVKAEERLLATTIFDALNSSRNLCLEYANSNKTLLKLKQKTIVICRHGETFITGATLWLQPRVIRSLKELL